VSGVSLPKPVSRIAPERPGTSWRRVAAAGVDYGLVGVCIGLLTLAGASARAADLLPEQLTTQSARWAAQLAAIGLLTVPVTLWLAWSEAAPRGATPGKRLLGLHVVAANGGSVSLRRSLLRSVRKVALPWELAHTAVWRMLVWPGDPQDRASLVLLLLANGIAVVYLAALFVGGGRTPYDRIAGTVVRNRLQQP
jgi:uncharacterized RDD family membrane protein YckC